MAMASTRQSGICSSGDWQKAHAIVQNDESEMGCWAHGIVHMLEGDSATRATGIGARIAPFPR